MSTLYEKYKSLKIDGSWIGLELVDGSPYFCTPIGAEIFGWDNGIHYCFIKEFGDIVFCVNPETCCDYYVYPIARNFRDFLGLLLATGNTNTLQQAIWWDKKMFKDFVDGSENQAYVSKTEVIEALNAIRKELNLAPIEKPFEYIKELQAAFPYDQICFSNEYYDTVGLDRPDGSTPDETEDVVDLGTVEFRFDSV